MDRSDFKIHWQNSNGFTLIEVLIAITILSFISLYTFRMVDNSTDTRDRVVKEDRTLLQTLTAVSRIDIDFSQIYSPLYAYSKSNPATDPTAVYQDSNAPRGSFDGKTKNGMLIPSFISEDKSTIAFFTQANRRKITDVKESRFAWVKYSLRRSEERDEEDKSPSGGYELVRQTIATNIYSDLNWNDVKAQVLLTGVKSLEFNFWDERLKKFVASLQDLNENKNNIRILKMDLVWMDENNREQKIEKIYRVINPYFNPKMDDLRGGAYGDNPPPPGTFPDPNEANPDPNGGNGGIVH